MSSTDPWVTATASYNSAHETAMSVEEYRYRGGTQTYSATSTVLDMSLPYPSASLTSSKIHETGVSIAQLADELKKALSDDIEQKDEYAYKFSVLGKHLQDQALVIQRLKSIVVEDAARDRAALASGNIEDQLKAVEIVKEHAQAGAKLASDLKAKIDSDEALADRTLLIFKQ